MVKAVSKETGSYDCARKRQNPKCCCFKETRRTKKAKRRTGAYFHATSLHSGTIILFHRPIPRWRTGYRHSFVFLESFATESIALFCSTHMRYNISIQPQTQTRACLSFKNMANSTWKVATAYFKPNYILQTNRFSTRPRR